MAGTAPGLKRYPIELGKPLDETTTPRRVDAGLTATNNVMYRRAGAIGSRPGSSVVFTPAGDGPLVAAIPSGIRWYAASPTPLTQVVVVNDGALYTGVDSGSLTIQSTFAHVATTPICFAPSHDPAWNYGNGCDILIFTGASTLTASAAVIFITPGQIFAAGDVYTVTLYGGFTVTVTYTVLASDNSSSIAAAITQLIAQSTACTPGTPFLAPPLNATNSSGVGYINLYAQVGGASGNAFTASITSTNGSANNSPKTATNFSAGGQTTSTPLKWDGTEVTVVSGAITQAFTGCVSWHNHVWYWGDPYNPSTLYASDINQPEGWQFMTTEGGYLVGPGDGDPVIQTCVPCGNILYVFKNNSVYAITGYDFQSGEYQFNIQPALKGVGVPYPTCVAQLHNALIFWTGTRFARLSPGSFDIESIGSPIQLTQGLISQSTQSVIRAVAGSFNMLTSLIGQTASATNSGVDEFSFSNIALFSYNLTVNHAPAQAARYVAVYDDDATQINGAYSWSTWSLPSTIFGWVPFTGGKMSGSSALETSTLYYLTGGGASLAQIGSQVNLDTSTPVVTTATTGWITCGTPALIKELHQIYLEVMALAGVQISITVTPSIYVPQATGQAAVYAPQTKSFQTTLNYTGSLVPIEQMQVLKVTLEPFVRANAFQFQITMTTLAANTFAKAELVSMTLDYIEEAFLP